MPSISRREDRTSPLSLPPEFVGNIRQAFPREAEAWMQNLPELLSEAARGWDLELGAPFLLSYNYVCAARRGDGSQAVLKIGVPNRELTSEINTLRLYDGRGAPRLIEADAERGLLLEERLRPGTMLASMEDDERATEIAAGVMQLIQRPVPQQEGFLSLRGWFGELKNLRPRFGGGTGPFPPRLVERVEALLPELFATSGPDVLLHGDFHHYNILLSERGWLVIDPKGVAGPRPYEVGPLLMNPVGELLTRTNALRQTQRRIAILAERLGIERRQLRDWALAHCVLSAWWDLAEDGSGGEYSLACAQMMAEVKI